MKYSSLDNRDTFCKTYPKFSIFPFFKMQNDNVSAKLKKDEWKLTDTVSYCFTGVHSLQNGKCLHLSKSKSVADYKPNVQM